MGKLTVFDFSGQAIRSTSNGQFSVYDVLVAFGVTDKAHCQETLKRILQKHSEVNSFCGNFKFPGRGQKETPITDEEGMYKILMLCPGNRGAEFRKWASRIIKERVEEENDGELAYNRGRARAIRVWQRHGMTAKDIDARLKGIEQRHLYTDTLKLHGVSGMGYAQCTNVLYQELFDCTANELKEQRRLKKTDSARDSFDYLESAATMFAEAKATRDIETNNLHGNNECKKATQKASRAVRKALDS